jgi:hypothetical protein
MFKLFKKVQWRFVSASNIRAGDVVSDVIKGEVVYVYTQTFPDSTLVTLVISMRHKMFDSKIGTITVPPTKKIKVAKR